MRRAAVIGIAIAGLLSALALGIALLTGSGGKRTAAPASSPVQQPTTEPAEPLPTAPSQRDGAEELVTYDAYVARELTRLREFVAWLEVGDMTYERPDGSIGYKGFIGEWGYPSRAGTQCTGNGAPATYSEHDVRRWNVMGRRYLAELTKYGIWATWWAAGFPEDYNKVSHIDSRDGLTETTPAGDMLAGASVDWASGVNLAGAEWARQYPTDADFRYLEAEGISLVRLPLDWEHVLTQEGLDALYRTVDAATRHNVGIVLDLHNYGQSDYWSAGSTRMETQAFVDVWVRLSDHFHSHSAVVGYGLMNEPNHRDTFFDDPHAGARWWQATSQAAVTALRNRGDDTRIFVSGWNWATIQGFDEWTPEPWIDDPVANTWYEAHHYFDGLGDYRVSGDSSYAYDYDAYLSHAVESGFDAFQESADPRIESARAETQMTYDGRVSC